MTVKAVALPDIEITHFATEGRKVFVVSDLHMAAGRKADGNFDGTENFYADQSFVRFLGHLQESLKDGKGILVINGDFIDFLRITTVPEEAALPQWQAALLEAGIEKPIDELRNAVSAKEKKFGLRTHEFKSIWKLVLCLQGHPAFFNRLAQWVQEGNWLLILQGNHDLEWQWPGVQRYFKRALEKRVAGGITSAGFDKRILFVKDALLFDERVYIEHGHRYEKITWPIGEPTINNGTELNLPFGSFLNRYLINGFELSYPFLDNVRPTPNILKVLLKENFWKALRVIAWDLPKTLFQIPRQYLVFILQYLLPLLLLIIFPVLSALITFFTVRGRGGFDTSFLSSKMIGNLVLCTAAYFIAYYIGKGILALLLKKELPFYEEAKKILEQSPKLEAVLMGHTHDPEQKNNTTGADAAMRKNKWYFNTGTWIPVFETSSADVRFDKTYTFLVIDLTGDVPCREFLQRWNDDAVRVDAMVLNDKM